MKCHTHKQDRTIRIVHEETNITILVIECDNQLESRQMIEWLDRMKLEIPKWMEADILNWQMNY